MQRHCLLLLRGLRSSTASLQATKTKSGKSHFRGMQDSKTGAVFVLMVLLVGSTADPGSKAILYSILTDTSVPLNSAQIWEQAEVSSLASQQQK